MQVPWLRFPAEVPNAMPSEAGMTVRYSQSVAKETDRRSPERCGPQFSALVESQGISSAAKGLFLIAPSFLLAKR